MRSLLTFVLAWGLVYSVTAQAQVAEGNPEYDTVATAIPGVIAAGARIRFLDDGYRSTEGPIALPDGSIVFTETRRNRLMRVDQDGNGSRWLFNTNGANGLAFDSEGRLIAVQTMPGKTAVAVIYPAGQEKVLSDNYEGKPYGRPNDLVVDKKGRGLFHRSRAERPGWIESSCGCSAACGLLHSAGGKSHPGSHRYHPSERHPAQPGRAHPLRQ